MGAASIVVVARVLLASVFVVIGLQRLVTGLALVGEPAAAMTLGTLSFSIVEVIVGLLIVVGWRLRMLASLAAAALLVDALLSHPFWLETGPAWSGQLLHFMKNISAIGGFLLLAAVAGEGPRKT